MSLCSIVCCLFWLCLSGPLPFFSVKKWLRRLFRHTHHTMLSVILHSVQNTKCSAFVMISNSEMSEIDLITQWISLLYRRVQKIEQIKPDHCDRYQNNRTKKCNWMALVSYIGNGGNISQISLKCRKSLNLIKLLKSWQFIISLKTFGGLINYFK